MNGSGLQIGEIATHSDVSVDTVRYYEKLKLLPRAARSGGGYRIFPAETVERIKFIKQAQSLKEIKELLNLQAETTSIGTDIREKVEAKIADIDGKMKSLLAIKKV